MKFLTVVGARPQFIKAAPVSKLLRKQHHEVLLHTGQHYDDEMSAIFFRELRIPKPDYNLGIGSASHGSQTGQMLARIEEILQAENPTGVLVYGDTNSTLAGALAAIKLQIPVAHVEAGLRSFNRSMPEEHNRVLTDHCSDLLFCPTQTAVNHLTTEGITQGVHLVGDVMYDAVREFGALARQQSTILEHYGLSTYFLATVHRPYNTDNPERLRSILSAFSQLNQPVIFPAHPRTRKRIKEFGLEQLVTSSPTLHLIEPVGYLDMLMLEQNARLILTDSGGVQKEAYFFAVPCVTLRPETEWIETVEVGWNYLVDAGNSAKIKQAVINFQAIQETPPPVFGDGHAAQKITHLLSSVGG